MNLEHGDLTCSGAELAALASHFEIEAGPLSRLPELEVGDEARSAAEAWCSGTNESLVGEVESWLRQLAAPERIGVMHQTIGDEEIGRAMLAWGNVLPDKVVMLMNTGENWVARAYPMESLVETFYEILLLSEPTRVTPFARRMSADALLVLIAISELLSEHHLFSLLSHHLPSGKFTLDGVADSLASLGKTDFRWPGKFLDKVMPRPIATLQLEEDLGRTFRELKDLELVMETTDESGAACYQLTDNGETPAGILRDHVTKIALRMSVVRDDGKRGNEIFFFVRSPADLCLFDIAGSESIATTLGPAQLRSFLNQLLTGAPAGKEIAEEGEEVDGVPTLGCPACGCAVPQESARCPECGTAMPGQFKPGTDRIVATESAAPRPTVRKQRPARAPVSASTASKHFCYKCGTELDNTGAAFCRKCGAKIRKA